LKRHHRATTGALVCVGYSSKQAAGSKNLHRQTSATISLLERALMADMAAACGWAVAGFAARNAARQLLSLYSAPPLRSPSPALVPRRNEEGIASVRICSRLAARISVARANDGETGAGSPGSRRGETGAMKATAYQSAARQTAANVLARLQN